MVTFNEVNAPKNGSNGMCSNKMCVGKPNRQGGQSTHFIKNFTIFANSIQCNTNSFIGFVTHKLINIVDVITKIVCKGWHQPLLSFTHLLFSNQLNTNSSCNLASGI